MSLTAGLPGYVATSSADPGRGILPSRMGGPVLSGRVADNVSSGPGPLYRAGGFICVQSTASVVNQVITTSATALGARASFVYIPVSTGPMTGCAAPPYVGTGTPLVWDDTLFTLSIWSSTKTSWMTLVATTSIFSATNIGGFTTSQ